MLGFHSQNVPITIIEDDMKFARLPLPTDDLGGWRENVLSTTELISIYTQAKNEQIDGVMIVDSIDYGGRYEQRAISTGLRVNSSEVRFDFNYGHITEDGRSEVRFDSNYGHITEDGRAIGRGFVNGDQTQAIYRVIITSAGVLTYSYTSLE